MFRAILVIGAIAVVGVAACNPVVYVGPRGPVLDATVEVSVIDATPMTREEVERVLEEHVMVARYFEFLPEEDGSERLAGPIRTGRIRAREAGADVLMYSRNSGLVGAILRDARFSAKDKDDVAFYLMRRR